MSDIADRLTKVERDQTHPNLRPRDAATLILVDRSGPVPKVLLGKRHAGHQVHARQVRVSRRRRRAGRQRMPVAAAARSAAPKRG